MQAKGDRGQRVDVCEHGWHPLEEKLSGKGCAKILEQLEALEEYEELVY